MTKQFGFTENKALLANPKEFTGRINIFTFKSNCRSWVPCFVYLPPNWNPEANYPLVLFLHGQGGDETTFQKYVQAKQLNRWINSGEIEPVVIAGVRGDDDRENVQWFTAANEHLLIKEMGGEFIAFCQHHFKAGEGKQQISLEGHSRGAAGALHYYLKYPGLFASVVAMGYVSSYTLENNYRLAIEWLDQIQEYSTPLLMEIGSHDRFVLEQNRRCSFDLHHFFIEKNIDHSFELLQNVEHGFDTFWNYQNESGLVNGLSHLQFHQRARFNK